MSEYKESQAQQQAAPSPSDKPATGEAELMQNVLDAVEQLATAAFIHGMHYQGNELCVEQRANRASALAAATDALSHLIAAHAAERDRAVMAERQRCAAIARDMQPAGGRQWTDEQLACFSALEDCAKNIESGLVPPSLRARAPESNEKEKG